MMSFREWHSKGGEVYVEEEIKPSPPTKFYSHFVSKWHSLVYCIFDAEHA